MVHVLYISVFDHSATDPVMQTNCNLWRRFFCALWVRFSPLTTQANIFCYLNLDICNQFKLPPNLFNSFLYRPIYSFGFNLLPSESHVYLIPDDLKQASIRTGFRDK
jgi:hypothetical protein